MNLVGKKVKAFTLLELIVVLVLSGVCTLMAYYALNITRSYYHKFNEKEQLLSAFSKLAMIIDQDFQNAHTITGDRSGIICNFDTHQVTYRFMPAYAIRSQSQALDTFHVAVNDISIKKNSEDGKGDGLIKELQLIVGLTDSVFFHFNKKYSAATLFRIQLENATKWEE